MWKTSFVSAPGGTRFSRSTSGMAANAEATPGAASASANSDACSSENPSVMSAPRVEAFACVAFGASAALDASASNQFLMNCSNESRLMGVEHIVAAHASCSPGGTQREHKRGFSAYASRVGALRQKSSKPAVETTASSTRRMKSSRACSSTFPPGGRVSYTVVSQYAACDCLRSTSGMGGGAFAGAGGAGGPLIRRVCALDHCSAASTLS
mmetsp:Transcript_8043/g.34212  ORF Transcript_8043/g.34212 Transcript_8043/m.34212 type:complete len:211 (-) Transcript_8043:234-866(-)